MNLLINATAQSAKGEVLSVTCVSIRERSGDPSRRQLQRWQASLLTLLLLLTPFCQSTAQAPRPTANDFSRVCDNIFDRSKDPDENSDFIYLYERSLWKMAGARPGVDTREVAARKLRALWDMYHDDMECNTVALPHGNILKYAIHSNFFQFVEWFAGNGMSLNYPDRYDGKTVLDYVEDMIATLEAKHVDNAAEMKEMRDIYRVLRRELGAKHARELTR